MNRISIFLIIFLMFSTLVWAKNCLWLNGSASHLYYEEREEGEIVDKDHGWMGGFGLGISSEINNIFGKAEFNWARTNGATYKGATQEGIPIEVSDIIETIWNVEGDIGYILRLSHNLKITPYLGLGYRRWRRGQFQLIPTSLGYAFGYKEVYRWGYGIIGLNTEYEKDKYDINFDLGIFLPFARKMTAYLDEIVEQCPNPKFDLGFRPGMKLQMCIAYEFIKNWAVFIQPTYEWWQIGKSDMVTFKYNDQSIEVYEPESSTHFWVIPIGLRYIF